MCADGDEAFALFGFWWQQVVVACDVGGLEPVGDCGVFFEALELVAYFYAVHAVSGDEFAWGEAEAFGLTHACFEGEMPHEVPHVFFFLVCSCERGVWFECCGLECGEGLCWLSWLEDGGFLDDVAWWSHLECWVGGDEFFLDGLGEDLAYADVVVVDCFAAAVYAEGVESVFDVVWCDLVEGELS